MLLVWMVCSAVALALSRLLDGLVLGEDSAASLGLRVAPLRAALVAVIALATGAAVAQTGLIAFVGLAAPHLVRSIIATGHAWLVLLSGLMGGLLLLAADALARGVVAPRNGRSVCLRRCWAAAICCGSCTAGGVMLEARNLCVALGAGTPAPAGLEWHERAHSHGPLDLCAGPQRIAGKSTLLKALAGVLQQGSGSAEVRRRCVLARQIAGQPVVAPARADRVVAGPGRTRLQRQ
jgi:hypothetical protein